MLEASTTESSVTEVLMEVTLRGQGQGVLSTTQRMYNENTSNFHRICSNCSINGSYGSDYDLNELNLSLFEIRFYIILWTYFAPIMFSLILILGTAGNGLVVYVILKNRQLQSVTNVFLLSLAVADLLFLVFCVPVTAYKYAAANWTLGDTVCKLTHYVQYATVYITIWTLVCVSLLRYMTIVLSTRTAKLRTKQNAVKFVILQWLVCLALNTPVLSVYYVKSHHYMKFCGTKEWAITPLLMTFFTLGYLVPLIIICIMYLMIMGHLKSHKQNSTAAKEASKERNIRACRLVTIVILVFGIMWLPRQVQSMVIHFAGSVPHGMVYDVFRILWECMAFGNSCANPFIYTCASRDFRKYFKEAFSFRLRSRASQTYNVDTVEESTRADYETEKTSLV